MKFWDIKNTASDEGELILYGDIMDSRPWWSEGQVITPEDFIADMELIKNKSKIVIKINSRGGNVFAAQAIHDYLVQLKCKKQVRIEGLAASAATIITSVADEVLIGKGGQFMIHNPAITVWDTFQADDFEKMKNMLDSIKNGIIETYMKKTSLSKDEISQMMDDEKWMTGAESIELGFCDGFLEDFAVSNSIMNKRLIVVNNVPHDLSGFKNIPVFNDEMPIENESVKINNINEKEGMVKAMKTVEEVKAACPDLVKQIENVAYEKGKEDERKRMKDIDAISNTIADDLIKDAKYDNPIDAKTLAFNAVQQEQLKAKDFAQKMKEDAEASGTDVVTAEPKGTPENKAGRLSNMLNKDKRRN